MNSAIYLGSVMHHRRSPIDHRFVYSVFSLLIDLDELASLDRKLRWFSLQRRNLVSFDNRDHGPRDGTELKPWVLATLEAAGILLERPRILLLSFPRVLGYVFNPLSAYFCEDGEGSLRAVIYEVKNTFGGQHCYVFDVAGHARSETLRHRCAKEFYVSPFMDVSGSYRFTTRRPGRNLLISIDFSDEAGNRMVAVQTGERQTLSDMQLLQAVVRTGFLTAKVIAGIHFEAFRLWLKGAKYYPKRLFDRQRINPGTG